MSLMMFQTCPCPHDTCTDGRVCNHMEPDTAGQTGDRRKFTPEKLMQIISEPLTPAELAEIHDRGEPLR